MLFSHLLTTYRSLKNLNEAKTRKIIHTEEEEPPEEKMMEREERKWKMILCLNQVIDREICFTS